MPTLNENDRLPEEGLAVDASLQSVEDILAVSRPNGSGSVVAPARFVLMEDVSISELLATPVVFGVSNANVKSSELVLNKLLGFGDDIIDTSGLLMGPRADVFASDQGDSPDEIAPAPPVEVAPTPADTGTPEVEPPPPPPPPPPPQQPFHFGSYAQARAAHERMSESHPNGLPINFGYYGPEDQPPVDVRAEGTTSASWTDYGQEHSGFVFIKDGDAVVIPTWLQEGDEVTVNHGIVAIGGVPLIWFDNFDRIWIDTHLV